MIFIAVADVRAFYVWQAESRPLTLRPRLLAYRLQEIQTVKVKVKLFELII